MATFFFDNAYFLQSIGWAIINSFWQAATLWILYHTTVHLNKKLPAVVKYQLSLLLIYICACWFGFTTVQNYSLLLHAEKAPNQYRIMQFLQVNKALPFVALAYLGILLFYTLRFIRHYLQLRFVSTNDLLKAPVDIRIFVANTALHLGIKKKVQVWLSEYIDVPSVTGFIKPIILLPAAVINHLSIEQVNTILLHELAHIKRNDFLLNFIQYIIALLLFFNPFVYWLHSIAKKERENCCDDWVLNFECNGLEYAKALLILEEQRHRQLVLALSATNNKKILLQRIKRLFVPHQLQPNTNWRQKFQLHGLTVLLVTGVCLLPSFINNQVNQQKTIYVISTKTGVISKEGYNTTVRNEYAAAMVFKKNTGVPVLKKAGILKPKPIKKRPVNNSDDYVLAMINEDVLTDKSNTEEWMPVAVSSNEKDSILSLFVKVEEEQSGKKEVNTYYFKLNKEKGKTDIKPLLFIKRYKAAKQKNSLKGTHHKKRITT